MSIYIKEDRAVFDARQESEKAAYERGIAIASGELNFTKVFKVLET
jgi:hypothetical protein